jgi:hypothetical protein
MLRTALPVIVEGALRQLYLGFTKRIGGLSASGHPPGTGVVNSRLLIIETFIIRDTVQAEFVEAWYQGGILRQAHDEQWKIGHEVGKDQ